MSAEPGVGSQVEDWLCVALGDASRAMVARYRDLLAPYGLTYPQYIAMSWLWQEGDLSISQLADRMGLDPSTTSPMVKRLEVAGLTVRSRDTGDERRVVVSLTEAGREMRERTRDVPEQISVATGMSRSEQEELVARLKRLVGSLSEAPTL